MEALVIRYGLVAILLGSGIEGEPFALAGGVLAHRHWLPLWQAIAAAVAGALLVDQGWFHLSRRFREHRRIRKLTERPAFERCLGLLERHPILFILLFRFAYGLRAVAPAVIGLSSVPARAFVPLNILAAIVWGTGFTLLGYALGPAVEAAEAKYGGWIWVSVLGLSALALWLSFRRGKGGGHPGRSLR